MISLRVAFRLAAPGWRCVSFTSCRNVVAPTESTATVEKMIIPPPENVDRPENPKLSKICDDISQLNLLEVSELSSLLKKRLNLPETSFMPAMMPMMSAGKGAEEDDEAAAPQKVQTSFKVKLVKFDEKQKVALIKEIKNMMENMNLVQAKKFVESAPALVKEDIPKDEAEKLKETLSKVGAIIEIE